jgi:hypothetical protein
MPEIRSEDVLGVVQAFAPLLQAIVMGEDAGLHTKFTSGRAWHKALQEFGIDLDTEKELADSAETQIMNTEMEATRHNRQLEQLFRIAEDDS